MKDVEAWWLDALQTGELGHLEGDNEGHDLGDWHAGPLVVSKAALRGAYSIWMRDRRFDGGVVSDSAFTTRLKRICEGLDTKQRRAVGSGARKWYYIVPPLKECRGHYDKAMKRTNGWPALLAPPPEDDEPDDL
ncbi:hypothetical protein [Frigidibacter sp. MR17.24]|uniref:hypothetical protein n=1 Tax=Frigidibacter sp. MR17.24 TaxID=3127345 RepID=UPI003012D512